MPVNLSYFLTTYNKLPYLKIIITDLITNRKHDEEIVISDGGSTDGTVEYLQQLLNEKKIQKFISNKDKGEAHGLNRALLLCEGEILKWINDDDIFCYKAIEECKNYLIANKEIDIIGSDGFDNYEGNHLVFVDHKNHYLKWKHQKEPFGFYGLGLMMRKSALPLIGIFNSLVKFVDNEYTFRATSLPVCMVWYSKPLFVRVINPDSNTLKYSKVRKNESLLNSIYRKIAINKSIFDSKQKEFITKGKGKVYNLFYKKTKIINKQIDLIDMYENYKTILYKSFDEKDSKNNFIF